MDAKRILMCATLLLGLVAFNGRLSAAVESDIVGYTTIEMEAGKWYQVGTPFVPLTDGETLQLNDIFADGFADGDSVNVLDASMVYTPYYWKSAAGGWCTKRGTAPVALPLPTGKAVFINKAVAGKVTLSGKVSVSEAVPFGSEAGSAWDQIVCVYPQATKLNDIKWTGLTDGDSVNVYNSDAGVYVPYYWKNSAGGWCTKRGTALADVDIGIGQALFVNKVSAGQGTCSIQ